MKLFILSIIFCAINIAAFAQQDIYIRIEGTPSNPGIKGESTVRDYVDWIEAQAYSGGDKVNVINGQPNFCCADPVSFTIITNRSLPLLRQRLLRRQILTNVNIEYTISGQTSFVYYKILMEDVYISEISEGGGTGDRNTFNISFVPSKIKYTYIPRTSTGAAGTPVIFGWDYTANREF